MYAPRRPQSTTRKTIVINGYFAGIKFALISWDVIAVTSMDHIKKTFAGLRQKAKDTAATRWSRKELAQIALLKDVHQETIAPLLRDCPVRVMASGDVLLRSGEACAALFMVLSGRLRMLGASPKIPDTVIRAGDCVGELSLLERTTVATAILAVDATRLLVIDRDTAWTLIRSSHEIARNWLTLLATRTRTSGTIATEELKTSHVRETTHDEGSGLHNRQWLDAMLPRHIARCTAGRTSLSLLLIEIDGFGDYSARIGDAAAEQAHRAVAQAIVTTVRPTDLVVCYDAAQFAVVLPESDAMNACLIGERVRKAAGTLATDQGSPVTVSIGAAEYRPSTNVTDLLTAAEAALQMAKTSGGNRVGM